MTLIEMTERIQRLEVAVGQINVAISNLAAKRQLNHILTLLTRQITDLQSELTDVKAQLEVLKR